MQEKRFERLYEEHAEALLRFLIYRVGDRPLAEDILADTFERVLRGGWRFDSRRAGEKTWIYTIALNLVRDNARRAQTAERALARSGDRSEEHEAQAAELSAAEVRGDLQAALETLSEEEREVVTLRFGADLPMREVARVLGERQTTVDGRLYRGIDKLRRCMRD